MIKKLLKESPIFQTTINDLIIQTRYKSQVIKIGVIIALSVLVTLFVSIYMPHGIDWRDTYRPAALALISGKSPYHSVEIFYAAPWSLIPLIPLALLPENLGRAILLVVSLSAFGFTVYRLGAKPLAMGVFLLSPPVIHCLLNANIEWLPLLGFVMPPQIGLLFISIKPQIGLGVGLFWLVKAWQKGGLREVFRVFWPLYVALILSFALFGFWPLRFQDTLTLTRDYNASLWPASLPIGLVLMITALRKHDKRYAMAASPCLSPYVLFHAWVGALASLVSQPIETVTAVIGLWILVIIRALSGTG